MYEEKHMDSSEYRHVYVWRLGINSQSTPITKQHA